jgi:hypothetical protein
VVPSWYLRFAYFDSVTHVPEAQLVQLQIRLPKPLRIKVCRELRSVQPTAKWREIDR